MDISTFGPNSVDLIFSHAAFEHFDDIDATFQKMSDIARPGCKLVSMIDLKTHTRWISDKDPLNIYRYGDLISSLLKFRGTPNRVRPHEYR